MNGSFSLIGALIGLARALEGKEFTSSASHAIMKGLYLASPGIGAESRALPDMVRVIHEEKAKAAPDCASCQSPCGRTADFDMKGMWNARGKLYSEKFLLLSSLCFVGSAAYMAAETSQDETEEEVIRFLCDGLFLLGYAYEAGQLDAVLSKAGEICRRFF